MPIKLNVNGSYSTSLYLHSTKQAIGQNLDEISWDYYFLKFCGCET